MDDYEIDPLRSHILSKHSAVCFVIQFMISLGMLVFVGIELMQ